MFLTPIVIHAARQRDCDERPVLYGTLFMANGASLLLPGSNDAFYDLGHVLEADARYDEATAAYRQALHRYERKEILPLARLTGVRLEAIQFG